MSTNVTASHKRWSFVTSKIEDSHSNVTLESFRLEQYGCQKDVVTTYLYQSLECFTRVVACGAHPEARLFIKIIMAPSSRMVTLDSDIFKCCQNLKTLGWENDAHAKSLLQRAANQVKPIMARRKWAVPLLSEFYPPAPNLLGLNHDHGQRIDIRLRSPSSRSSFLPYQSILGTLLHELAHIEVGPHNAAFYKLLDELNKECDDLIAAGNDGSDATNFIGKGNRLGDWSVRTVPRHLTREKALVAAQKRQRVGAIMSKGGARLGGSADIARLCDPREMALAAAERRRADDIWCGSAPRTDAMPDSTPDVIVVNDDDSPEVIVISDDETQSNTSKVIRPQPQTPYRESRNSVPVRQNPIALAALRRAGRQG